MNIGIEGKNIFKVSEGGNRNIEGRNIEYC